MNLTSFTNTWTNNAGRTYTGTDGTTYRLTVSGSDPDPFKDSFRSTEDISSILIQDVDGNQYLVGKCSYEFSGGYTGTLHRCRPARLSRFDSNPVDGFGRGVTPSLRFIQDIAIYLEPSASLTTDQTPVANLPSGYKTALCLSDTDIRVTDVLTLHDSYKVSATQNMPDGLLQLLLTPFEAV